MRDFFSALSSGAACRSPSAGLLFVTWLPRGGGGHGDRHVVVMVGPLFQFAPVPLMRCRGFYLPICPRSLSVRPRIAHRALQVFEIYADQSDMAHRMRGCWRSERNVVINRFASIGARTMQFASPREGRGSRPKRHFPESERNTLSQCSPTLSQAPGTHHNSLRLGQLVSSGQH